MAWAAYSFLAPKPPLSFVQTEPLSEEINQLATSAAMPIASKEPIASREPIASKEPVAIQAPIENNSANIETVAVNQSVPINPESKPVAVQLAAVETKAIEKNNSAIKNTDTVAASGESRRLIQSANSVATLDVKTTRPLSNAEVDLQIKSQAERLLSSGLSASAINYLQEKLAGDVSKIKSASLYASLLIETQSYQQASNLLQDYQQANPDYLELAKLQVRLAMAQQDFSQALERLDRLAIPVNRDAGFTEMRAAILQTQGNYADAAESYRQLLQYDNQRSRWWMGLATSLDADAKFSEAKQAYRKAMFATDLPDKLSLYASRRIAQL
jgi:MSHA biogenesis protein MshN